MSTDVPTLPSATAFHEAAHAVAASGLADASLRLVSVTAAADACVRTKYKSSASAAEAMGIHERLALVDLCGPAAELRHLRQAAWAKDEENAAANAVRVVLLRRGSSRDAVVTDEVKGEAAALVEQLRARAERIVEANWPAIKRVAAALAAGGTLNAAQVDALLEDSKSGG